MTDHSTDAAQIIFQRFLRIIDTLRSYKAGTDIDGILPRHIKCIAGGGGKVGGIPGTLVHWLVNIRRHLLLPKGLQPAPCFQQGTAV